MQCVCTDVPEISLPPGGFYFGRERRVRTILGSCVSITMWHPGLRIGGMCHYMLPSHARRRGQGGDLDGRYADDALALFMRELGRSGTAPHEYEVKVFGGGRMLAGGKAGRGEDVMEVGIRNIATARRLLGEQGFRVKAEHLGGDGHRNLLFDVGSGEIWVRHVALPPRARSEVPGMAQS
ncbi:MAG: chemotaxis protein CheD [Rhodocyclales bacterium]|nr:chemotaxis protein CheD [Rhodocyclales bacterium]